MALGAIATSYGVESANRRRASGRRYHHWRALSLPNFGLAQMVSLSLGAGSAEIDRMAPAAADRLAADFVLCLAIAVRRRAAGELPGRIHRSPGAAALA
jgi:hypothetical protein